MRTGQTRGPHENPTQKRLAPLGLTNQEPSGQQYYYVNIAQEKIR